MAISAVMLFKSTGDVRNIYDAVIDEMGVRDNPPAGEIYHWAAPVSGGMQVCDVWETREQYETFARERIGPITAKHGLAPPQVEIANVHVYILGKTTSRKGAGLLVDFTGKSADLLDKIDRADEHMNVKLEPPQGLVFHCTTASPGGIRVIDHWRALEDFERFVDVRLAAAMESTGLPQPHVTHFEIYNTLDPRVTARV